MLFNSVQFLIFFPIVGVLYFLINHKYRWVLLLIASCYFYMAFVPVYILILGFTIVVDYCAGIFIEKSIGKKRKVFLVASLVANIGVLAFFKYFNFFNGGLSFLLKGFAVNNPIPYLSIILPIGLSFHTFQAMSYTIEVYRGKQLAERNLGIFALYVMFFPQLVAGPIERPQNLLPQFRVLHRFDYERAASGLRLMLWGFFKKIVIADRLAIFVNEIYNHSRNYDSISLILATVFFSFQIYCDFSGYSDIAIGAARVMGFKLMKNFDLPYYSKSISEFWRRWHISLSTWFRDYLYIPLGGNRTSKLRYYFNLFFIFLVSGLWHGANWTYVVWGSLHGFYMVAEKVVGDVKKRFFISRNQKVFNSINFFGIVITFLLTNIAWIFFRANSINDAFLIFKKIISFNSSGSSIFSLDKHQLIIAFFSLVILEGVHLVQRHIGISNFLLKSSIFFRWSVYYAIIILILVMGEFRAQSFIYFQF